MMWFCYNHWSQGTQWEVLLAIALCHSGNYLSVRCISRFMAIMPWILLEWVFPFTTEAPIDFIKLCVCVYYDVCFLLLGYHVVAMFNSRTSTIVVCTLKSFKYTNSRHMCLQMMVCGLWYQYTKWLLLTHLSFQPFLQYSGAYTFWDMESHTSLCLFYMMERGSYLPGSAPPGNMASYKSSQY